MFSFLFSSLFKKSVTFTARRAIEKKQDLSRRGFLIYAGIRAYEHKAVLAGSGSVMTKVIKQSAGF